MHLTDFFLLDLDVDPLPHLPAPQIQLVRRSYRTLQDVISGFDISVCALAYNGRTIFARDDVPMAMSTGVIVASSANRSYQYEDRLLKYVTRGWALSIPELDCKRVAPNLLEQGLLFNMSVYSTVLS